MSHVSAYEKAVASLDASIEKLRSQDGLGDPGWRLNQALADVVASLEAVSSALKANAPTIPVRAPFGPTRTT